MAIKQNIKSLDLRHFLQILLHAKYCPIACSVLWNWYGRHLKYGLTKYRLSKCQNKVKIVAKAILMSYYNYLYTV